MKITDYPAMNYCAECGELGPHEVTIGELRFWLCDRDLVLLIDTGLLRRYEYAANQRMREAGLSMLNEAMR